jgi:hypothetical protein
MSRTTGSISTALVEDTGQALEWGRVSHYSGRDAMGTERRRARRSLEASHVPAGHYYLRVEPEWEPGTSTVVSAPQVDYTITIKRVTVFWPYLVSLILLLFPAVAISLKSWAWEIPVGRERLRDGQQLERK